MLFCVDFFGFPASAMPNQMTNILFRTVALAAMTILVLSAGCASSEGGSAVGEGPSARARGGEAFPGGDGRPGSMTDAGWSIVLVAYSGADARQRAGAAAETIRGRVDLPLVRVQDRGRGAAVVAGSYRSPADGAAQRDLARARAIALDGRTPFSSAFLAPPTGEADRGGLPQYHLSRAFTEFGSQSRYTLQIAVYESPNAREAERAAEQAAAQLRAEGEPAFYYHGPSRSMVTLGAFTGDEAGLETGLPGPILAELRRRHPYNLFNGRQLLQRVPGQSQRVPQPSFLVEIPRE